MRCAVTNCKNENKSKACSISFFSFPTNAALLKQWVSFCCRDNKMNVKTSQICMQHFKSEDFENTLQYEMGFTKRRLLKHGAVPTIRKVTTANEERYKERAQRIKKRENKKIVEALIKEHTAASDNILRNSFKLFIKDENETSVQAEESEVPMKDPLEETVFLLEHQEENLSTALNENDENINMKCLKEEIERLRKENSELNKVLKTQAAQLKDLEEKREKEAKIYEYNLDVLNNRLNQTKCACELWKNK